MKLSDLNFIKLLPIFMRQDQDIIALSEAMNEILRDQNNRLPTLATWNHIDQLTDEELTDLAWEFDVDWYDCQASHEIKVSQIQSAQLVKKRKGTKWAVEEAVRNLVGQAYLLEWFDFNGEPYTFEIVIKNPSVSQEIFDRMLVAVEKTKNVRSILTQVYYAEEHQIELQIKAQEHTGPFFFPKCGIARPEKIVRKADDIQINHPLKVQHHTGSFYFPWCGYTKTQDGKPTFGITYKETRKIDVTAQDSFGLVDLPICGLAILGPVEVGGGLQKTIGVYLDEKLSVVEFPVCGVWELAEKKEGD